MITRGRKTPQFTKTCWSIWSCNHLNDGIDPFPCYEYSLQASAVHRLLLDLQPVEHVIGLIIRSLKKKRLRFQPFCRSTAVSPRMCSPRAQGFQAFSQESVEKMSCCKHIFSLQAIGNSDVIIKSLGLHVRASRFLPFWLLQVDLGKTPTGGDGRLCA